MTTTRSHGRRSDSPQRSRKSKTPREQSRLAFWMLLPAAVAVFGIILYPVLRTLFISLFQVDSALATDTPFVGLAQLHERADQTPRFWAAMGRTLVLHDCLHRARAGPRSRCRRAAQRDLRGRWLFRAIVVIPWAVPTIVNAAMWKGIFNAQYGALNGVLTQLGLLDEYKAWLGDPVLALNAVVVADVWKTTPLVAFFLLAGLSSIPKDLYEAAKLDRASTWRTFRSITLPLLVPSIAIVLILRTVEAFKVFDLIYGMTRGGPANGTQTIAYYAYTTAFSDQEYGIGSAISYLIVLVILALSTIYLRLLRRSEMSLL